MWQHIFRKTHHFKGGDLIRVILDEYKYAETILNENILSSKPTYDIEVLVKYFAQVQNKSQPEIFNLIEDYLKTHLVYYQPSCWTRTISLFARKFSSKPLFRTNGVTITKSELNAIHSLKSTREERVMFTLLCLAKLGNLQNPDNNNWVNLKYSEIFKLAGVSVPVKKQCLIIRNLTQKNLLALSKRVDSLSVNVQIIDTLDNEQLMLVNDFRALGLVYLKYLGQPIVNCKKCGVLIKKTNNRVMYCRQCSASINRQRTLENYYNKQKN